MSRILIVEDEVHLAEGLRFNLEAEGHSVQTCEKGEEALQRLVGGKESFDLVVLDVMLPGKNGFTVAQELRQARNYVPVLMLTARSRPEDVLRGFECGADDYLAKPFDLSILLARITSLLRRTRWLRGPGAPAQAAAVGDTFSFDGRTVDFENLELRTGSKTYRLTVMETDLLRYLIRNAGHPVSREAILSEVWNLREDTDTRAIDNFIVRLRRYLEPDPSRPRYLLTVRGVGYKFVPKPSDP